jgi:LDH2 family malate/lactate/ureidoglycolate dehydrogenase
MEKFIGAKQIEISFDEILERSFNVLSKWGVEREVSDMVVSALIKSESEGYPSHGLIKFYDYVKDIEDGYLMPLNKPFVEEQKYCDVKVVNGNKSFGILVAKLLVSEFESMMGNSFVNHTINDSKPMLQLSSEIYVKESHHLGRLAHIGESLSSLGYISFGCVNYLGGRQKAVLVNGTEARLSTNPLMFSFPFQDFPIIVDLSTTVTSEGTIRIYDLLNLKVPEGYLVDRLGNVVTDAKKLFSNDENEKAFLLPFGGHKGSVLGQVVEFKTLAGGAKFVSPDSVRIEGNGGYFQVSRPIISMNEYFDSMSKLCEYLRSSKTINGSQVYLSGERSYLGYRESFINQKLNVLDVVWNKLKKTYEKYEQGKP